MARQKYCPPSPILFQMCKALHVSGRNVPKFLNVRKDSHARIIRPCIKVMITRQSS